MPHSLYVLQDLAKIEAFSSARPILSSYETYKQQSVLEPKKFKDLAKTSVIYPNYYASIIISQDGERRVQLMRYRLRPHWAEKDLPTRYNMHNARVDTLQTSRIWKKLLGKQHGILLFTYFYEWVLDENDHKILVTLKPKVAQIMCCPVLYDFHPGDQLYSFALITTDAPTDFDRIGKDRFPVVIKEDMVDEWLQPEGKSDEFLLKLLKTKNNLEFFSEKVKAFKKSA